MTTDEVKAILGEPKLQPARARHHSGTTYIYHTDKSDVKITFVNDKVIATEGSSNESDAEDHGFRPRSPQRRCSSRQ